MGTVGIVGTDLISVDISQKECTKESVLVVGTVGIVGIDKNPLLRNFMRCTQLA